MFQGQWSVCPRGACGLDALHLPDSLTPVPAPPRGGETHQPSAEAPRAGGRGHQLRSRVLREKDQSPQGILQLVRSHRSGGRPRSEERQAGPRHIPGLRQAVLPSGPSGEGERSAAAVGTGGRGRCWRCASCVVQGACVSGGDRPAQCVVDWGRGSGGTKGGPVGAAPLRQVHGDHCSVCGS